MENLYELLTVANQEIIERFLSQNEKNRFHFLNPSEGKPHSIDVSSTNQNSK